jgi:hypothetical protein
MANCFIIECVVADNKVSIEHFISIFRVEEWRSKIVRILTADFLGILLANFVVLFTTATLPFLPNSPKATIIGRFLT